MNSRAFTLFTALVSFVLIALAFVLVQSMIEAERASSQTIDTISEQTEMQNVADLARADALQVFNIGVRYQLEWWITDPQNEFYALDLESASDWQKMVDDFAAAELGSKEVTIDGVTKPASEQLAYRMANHLISNLQTSGGLQAYNFKGYDVWLQVSENPSSPYDATQFTNVLKEIINQSVESHALLEPIDCTEGSCELGTFYINLDLTGLSFAEYQKLPQIAVKSQASGRVIKQPILPKGNIRVFVPLRIFKAMWKARKIALGNFGGFGDSIKGLGLGMCDSDCSVRTSPKGASKKINPTTFPTDGKLCPNTPSAVGTSGKSLSQVDCEPESDCPKLGFYLADNSNDMGNVLREFISSLGITAFSNIDPDPGDGLLLWNGSSAPAGSVVRGEVKGMESKKILLYYNDTQAGIASEGKAYCARPTGFTLVLEFTETRSDFKVNEARERNVYKIKIVDNFQTQASSLQTCKSVIKQSAIVLGGGIASSSYSCEE
ncbi:MAG: hypothetical protein QT12_C0011G0002 [archaeon GW2011_AR21]|nr:MAG: hypothetical protein QT12_C0011G0002 [archaeon GW2011_AR21]HIH21817.1 hypothetical protein [Candidatus Diapherotrites archaeon]